MFNNLINKLAILNSDQRSIVRWLARPVHTCGFGITL